MGNAFFLHLLLLLVLSMSIFAATEAAPPPLSSRGGCTDQLILFSPCLSYVSSPPNNLTETASTKCCKAFSSSFAPNSLCFCHLLRDNHILGFPMNSTRLLSLSSLCLSPPPTVSSLNFLCGVTPTLPPLGSADVLKNPNNSSVTGSASSVSGGKTVPRKGKGNGAGMTLYFPSSNGSTCGGYSYKFLLLVMLPLFNLNMLYF